MPEILRETHQGRVVKVDSDYSDIVVTTLDNNQYRRAFETKLFKQAGIELGDQIELTFSTAVEAGRVSVYLDIVRKEISPEEIAAQVDNIMKGLDLGLIREKFGSQRAPRNECLPPKEN